MDKNNKEMDKKRIKTIKNTDKNYKKKRIKTIRKWTKLLPNSNFKVAKNHKILHKKLSKGSLTINLTI